MGGLRNPLSERLMESNNLGDTDVEEKNRRQRLITGK
jgi:hypothetical protein